MPDQPTYMVPLSVDPGAADHPIYFTHGPFAGRMVRTSAAELQKADAGRKYSRKDKRSLDPPPVIQVRFFEVIGAGTITQYEEEITTYDDNLILGLVCQVDLFPVVLEGVPDGHRDRPLTDLLAADVYATPLVPPSLQAPTFASTSVLVPGWPYPDTSVYPSSNSDIIAYYGGNPITESSKSTSILAGVRVASPTRTHYNNREVLAFAFGDLAVQEEGTYTLRYRVTNVFCKTTENGEQSSRIPVLASCFGGAFKIWSTKTFPGLAGSTALTQRLSRDGASVTVRSADHRRDKGRKRQKTMRSESSADSVAITPSSSFTPRWA